MVVCNSSESGDGTEKIFTTVEVSLSILKYYSESSTLSPIEDYMKIFKETFDAFKDLQKQIEENIKLPEPSPAEDPPSINVIRQEIKDIKATVAQIQSPKTIPVPT
ncbi:hypothetical protein K3495_g8889 [Podosphaera aphanis]|nr:hypothetical protein K3495_g8889 [Podosphaera aphanis]